MKKILAIILALITVITTVPFMAFAQSTKNAEENGQMTTETTATGNNSVGTYLAETFQEAQAEKQENASDLAGMSYLLFDGNTATVELATQVDAQLIVAIYSEDGTKMLASGMKDVTTEDSKVTVDITSTTLPEYYLVKAFLLDKNNHSALCGEFIDDTHTKVYQEFEALDIYDFDADKVINLDSNPDNNFLVVSNGAFEIFGDETTNTLVSADYDAGIYEFDNIADDIKSLKVGDVFYYQSDENYEVIKVKSIDINGSEATVVADSMDVEEAFEVIKINSTEFEDDSATYSRRAKSSHTDHNVEEEFVNGTFTVKLGEDEKGKIRPIISKDFTKGEEKHPEDDDEKDYNDSDFKFVAEATGSAKMTAKLVIYIKDDYKKVEFTVTGSVGIELKVGAKFDKEVLLGDFFFTFYKIVTIGVEIKFHFKISVILTISGTIEFVKGFKWTTATGKFTDVSKPCKFKSEVKLEGEVYIGLILAPYVNVISKNVVFVTFPIEVGATAKAVLSTEVASDKNHSCDACLDGDIDIKLEARAKVYIARDIDLFEKAYFSPKYSCTWHLWDFYYSFTYSEFGWGKCPYSKNIAESGKCGENMNWSIDEENGILYITGSGYMTDYDSEDSPWSKYINIKTVYIDKDVLRIGDNAFKKCSEIENVYFYGTETQWKQVEIGTNNKYLTEALIQYMDDSDQYDASGTCGDNLTWAFDGETGKLTIFGTGIMENFEFSFGSGSYNRPWESYIGNIKKVVIEDGVTTIGGCAFTSCDNLTSVTIGNSVKTISDSAFASCDNLTSVTIGDSVTTIGDDVFSWCDSLKSVTIPDSVITIGNDAFSCCISLTSVTIGASVTTIGNYAFYRCESLTRITIPDSVTTIGDYAFRNCSSLTSVTIGAGVTTTGSYVFSDCNSLTSITVDSNNQYYSNDEYGVLFNKDKTELIKYPAGNTRTSYTIPDSVTSIGINAFISCTSLTSVTIPDSVTSIGDMAFHECSNLTSVTIPDSVTSIGHIAFQDCDSLTNVTIPDSVTTIGFSAFDSCTSLTSVTIGNSVTTIGMETFSNCTSLTSVTIGNSVTTIGFAAFDSCTSLTSVTIPNSVTTIDYRAFDDCTSLTSVTIPDSVTTIGDNAFRYCDSLTDVYYSGTEAQWNNISFGSYNGDLTTATIHYNSTGVTYSLRSNQADMMSFASTCSTGTNVQTATAQNTVVNNEYVILVLKNGADINNFTDDDLLYIDQKTGEADEITFNYIPKSDDECIVYIIGIFSDSDSVKQEQITTDKPNEPEIPVEPEYNFTFSIQNPSRTEIRNKDGIILHANVEGNAPADSYVRWESSNGNFDKSADGSNLKIIAKNKGYTTFTAILCAEDGTELARSGVEMYSKSGFFDKIGGFFRGLFGLTKIYEN